MFSIALSWTATTLVLVGVYYISKPRLLGQYLMFGADLSWLTYSIMTEQYALSLQSIILLLICIQAIKNWKKAGIGV